MNTQPCLWGMCTCLLAAADHGCGMSSTSCWVCLTRYCSVSHVEMQVDVVGALSLCCLKWWLWSTTGIRNKLQPPFRLTTCDTTVFCKIHEINATSELHGACGPSCADKDCRFQAVHASHCQHNRSSPPSVQ